MASQLSIRRALGRNNLAALDRYLDDPLYKNRNAVIVAVGSFLSNGALALSNDDDEDAQADSNAASGSSKDSSSQAKKGRKTRKKHSAVDEQQQHDEQDEQPGGAGVESGAAEAQAGGESDEELPSCAAFMSESEKAELLQLVTSRTHDCHAYTRSKALQTLIALTSTRSLPTALLLQLPALAVDRLRDTSSAVRKYAVQLLSTLCQYNPLGPSLSVERERREIKRMGEEVQRLMEEERRRREERTKRAAEKTKRSDAKSRAANTSTRAEGAVEQEVEELELLDGDEEEQGEQELEEIDDAIEVSSATQAHPASAH